MQLLKDRIRKDGKIKEGNVLKVDSSDGCKVISGDWKRI